MAAELTEKLAEVRDGEGRVAGTVHCSAALCCVVLCCVAGLRQLAGQWSLENAGRLVFDRGLGCLGENQVASHTYNTMLHCVQGWAQRMVALNAEIFRLSGELKQQLPFYK